MHTYTLLDITNSSALTKNVKNWLVLRCKSQCAKLCDWLAIYLVRNSVCTMKFGDMFRAGEDKLLFALLR